MKILSKTETRRIDYHLIYHGKQVECVMEIDDDGERHYDFINFPEELEDDGSCEDEIIGFIDEDPDENEEYSED